MEVEEVAQQLRQLTQRQQHSSQMRRWYAANRVQWRQYVAARRQAHPEQWQASRPRYYQAHKDELRAKAREHYHRKKQGVCTDL